ncbi:unnamed protein product [Caenorhabditis bovis]|uniref:NADH:flavin oxidoreductase/NADH oxidase N-terminal domain-containing protein n=1 Tax=Caenorhabditis bovis TaxID=2654633 RepID=A0A8S1F6B3_9PELO|nr:unnamed protein product [Caenorhabditis bovis]
MVFKRVATSAQVSAKVLGETLQFRNGKKAQNRFLKAALTERLSTFTPENLPQSGIPTHKIHNLYEKWGNGQFGMILTGNVMVDPVHLEAAGNATIFKKGDNKERREAFQKWAKSIKADGALALAQLGHAGRQTPYVVYQTPFSASDVHLTNSLILGGHGKPIPLTTEQVKTEVIDRFVFAAKFCYESGFDGIQLHAAHGYLLAQFTSPTTNKRTDQYGGSLENRIRVILEIHEAIRKEIPASTGFLVGIKMNSVEFQDKGTTVDDAAEIAKKLEEVGFDFVELSGGTYEKLAFHHLRDSTRKREAFFLEFAQKIRPSFTKTVVYLTGGFRTVQGMVEAIEENATQGIGLGRPITAEPDLPKKILSGQVLSASEPQFKQDDFGATLQASVLQMWQLGSTSLKEANNDVQFGVTDFSDPSLTDDFYKSLEELYAELKEIAKTGKPANIAIKFPRKLLIEINAF